ncbi:hypothetical protein L1987_61162 [Smallanthus sonchifolius]|uniref:Uncharacterized protein n=1 Tax=Smallanthus sonchifolius TaxID=185202 RepID=A0ACB9D9Y9_9ASTR|nr:hypothetical protein L1987_61162 [Smallanthus sonchifolius]
MMLEEIRVVIIGGGTSTKSRGWLLWPKPRTYDDDDVPHQDIEVEAIMLEVMEDVSNVEVHKDKETKD